MRLLSRLERWFGRFAVPNVSVILIAGQVLAFGLIFFGPKAAVEDGVPQPNFEYIEKLMLVPELVLAGEVWRVVTFLFVPPISNPICAFFFWYLFYLMGTALEATWGTFRYNVYLLVGYVTTVAAAFLVPDMAATNGFLQASVFLAFAYLYPDFILHLFFIVPVKIKWLALLTWISYFLTVVYGDWMERAMVVASIANFLSFFGREILARMRHGHRRMTRQARALHAPPRLVHCCTICGITSEMDRNLDFRYCSQCAGAKCYCPEHLRNHEHVTEAAEAGRK